MQPFGCTAQLVRIRRQPFGKLCANLSIDDRYLQQALCVDQKCGHTVGRLVSVYWEMIACPEEGYRLIRARAGMTSIG